MGQYIGNIGGSSPMVVKMKASATGYVAGLVMLRSAANASGQMSISTTTSAADAVGILLDTGDSGVGGPITYSTTQGAEEAVYGVIVNPDALLRMQMVTGATGTAVTADTVATAVANGLTVVGGTSVASPDMDEGILWWITGANVGQSRKITSTSSVTSTVISPFPRASAVGETFCYAGINLGLTGMTLTTDLLKARTDIAVSTGAALTAARLFLAGTRDSYVDVTLSDNVWATST